MPVDEDEASEGRTAASAQKASIAFTTTQWSVVLEAQGQSPAAQEALEKLCRTYWQPVYGFIRRQGIRQDEAEDLTQGFFSLLLKRRDFDAVRKEKGRLRSYLLTSLKHFLASEQRRAMTAKRGKGEGPVRLEELTSAERSEMEPAVKQLLPDEPGTPSRPEIASQLGMTDNALRQAFHRFRHRYQVLLREEISHTVAIASDVEDELRHLIAVLRT